MSAGAVLVGTAFAILVIAAATVTVSVRDARIAVIGLLVALLAAPFLAEPIPDLRGITARLAGAGLGIYPLWMLYRRTEETTAGSAGGWVIDGIVGVVAALVAASAAVGWDVSGALGSSGLGALAAQLGQIGTALQRPFLPAVAAGGALLILAVSPVAFAREPLRLTMSLTLGLLGVTLVWAGLAGPPTPFADLCIAIALAAVAGGGGVVIAASRRASRPLPQSEGLRPLPPLHLPHRPHLPHVPHVPHVPERAGRGQAAAVQPAGQASTGLAERAEELLGPDRSTTPDAGRPDAAGEALMQGASGGDGTSVPPSAHADDEAPLQGDAR